MDNALLILVLKYVSEGLAAMSHLAWKLLEIYCMLQVHQCQSKRDGNSFLGDEMATHPLYIWDTCMPITQKSNQTVGTHPFYFSVEFEQSRDFTS